MVKLNHHLLSAITTSLLLLNPAFAAEETTQAAAATTTTAEKTAKETDKKAEKEVKKEAEKNTEEQPKAELPDPALLRQQYAVHPTQWPAATTADNVAPKPMAPLPHANPTPEPAMVALGERLFNDTILSRDNTVSCATCHEPRLMFGDMRRNAIGIDRQVGTRNTPNIFAIDQWESFFWDGRAKTAAEQAIMPIENPIEMDLPIDQAVARLNNDNSYRQQFAPLFNLSSKDAITKEMLGTALAEFERTIRLPDTPYQTFITKAWNNDDTALNDLTDQQLQGLHLFRTKALCMTCHEGELLSDNEFHVTGLHFYNRRFQDLGRYEHTKNPEDSGKFRTPSLLAASQTGPWMHNGLFSNFIGIINFYNHAGVEARPKKGQEDDPLLPKKSPLLKPLGLNREELIVINEFLKTL